MLLYHFLFALLLILSVLLLLFYVKMVIMPLPSNILQPTQLLICLWSISINSNRSHRLLNEYIQQKKDMQNTPI